MTDTEFKTELETELGLINTAISHVLKTGMRYEIGTGSSKRVFESDLNMLRTMRNEIRQQIKELDDDTNNAVILGASW